MEASSLCLAQFGSSGTSYCSSSPRMSNWEVLFSLCWSILSTLLSGQPLLAGPESTVAAALGLGRSAYCPSQPEKCCARRRKRKKSGSHDESGRALAGEVFLRCKDVAAVGCTLSANTDIGGCVALPRTTSMDWQVGGEIRNWWRKAIGKKSE